MPGTANNLGQGSSSIHLVVLEAESNSMLIQSVYFVDRKWPGEDGGTIPCGSQVRINVISERCLSHRRVTMHHVALMAKEKDGWASTRKLSGVPVMLRVQKAEVEGLPSSDRTIEAARFSQYPLSRSTSSRSPFTPSNMNGFLCWSEWEISNTVIVFIERY